jgi:hypothetical protein
MRVQEHPELGECVRVRVSDVDQIIVILQVKCERKGVVHLILGCAVLSEMIENS